MNTDVNEVYSFCETVTAGGASPWHIRKLTSKGKKLGGGADTKALCGRPVGWDIKANINDHALRVCCQGCREKLDQLCVSRA